jgi:hypothetical protein
MGRLVKGAAVAAEIVLPQVVGDEENEVRRVRCGERREEKEEGEEGVTGFHERHSGLVIDGGNGSSPRQD